MTSTTAGRRSVDGITPPRMRAAAGNPAQPPLRESIAARLGIDSDASNQEIFAAVDAITSPSLTTSAAPGQPDPESLLWAAAYGGSSMASEILAAQRSPTPASEEEFAYQAVFGGQS